MLNRVVSHQEQLQARRDPAAAGNAVALRAADWLCLAATPAFAVMALLTAVLGSGAPDMLCSAMQASPLSGMVPMYVLMSAFHSAPWLRLISGRRRLSRPNLTPRRSLICLDRRRPDDRGPWAGT